MVTAVDGRQVEADDQRQDDEERRPVVAAEEEQHNRAGGGVRAGKRAGRVLGVRRQQLRQPAEERAAEIARVALREHVLRAFDR